MVDAYTIRYHDRLLAVCVHMNVSVMQELLSIQGMIPVVPLE